MTERERLIEVLSNIDYACDNGSNLQDRIEFIADYLLANGVIVPPCKVGDTVYEICERRRSGKWQKAIVERVVHGIEIGIDWQKAIVERVVHGIEIGIDKILTARCGTTTYLYLSRLGETVFLTREEAEKVLKGDEQG